MRLRHLLILEILSESILGEAPIEDYQLIGDFNKGHSFRHKTDRRLLANPRYIERIKSMFANTSVDFRMYFVNSKEANIGYAAKDNAAQGENRRQPFLEEGEVTMDWLEEKMPEGLEQIQQQGGFSDDGINIIFTNNSGDERRPMTGWIIAHRTGHAILRMGSGHPSQYGMSSFFTHLSKILEDRLKYIVQMYGQRIPQYKYQDSQDSWNTRPPRPNYNASTIRTLLAQIGTFKSARDNTIRTFGEFIFECFAQYLLFGQVKFNRAPRQMSVGYAWGRPQMSYPLGQVEQSEADGAIDYIASVFEEEFSRVLQMARGRIFVM